MLISENAGKDKSIWNVAWGPPVAPPLLAAALVCNSIRLYPPVLFFFTVLTPPRPHPIVHPILSILPPSIFLCHSLSMGMWRAGATPDIF